MSRLHFIPAVAAVLALTASASQAFALAQAGAAQGDQSPTRITVTRQQVNLSPIVVYGQHFSFVAALQMYKKALTRPWSTSSADLDKLVCRWHNQTGTRIPSLFCMTNRAHRHLAEATKLGILTASSKYKSSGGVGALRRAFSNGDIPVVLSGFSTQNPIPRSTFAPLLKKLPPANASYTLRVTEDNGEPLIDYVIKNGELVKIRLYKDSEQTPSSD